MNKDMGSEEPPVRLNRFLAMCGLGSRRKVEDLISAGRVTIDGQRAPNPGIQVNRDNVVLVDARRVVPLEKIYLVMNKPEGVVCAVTDKYYRTVVDLLPEGLASSGVFPAGRLDRMTSGMLILTNDGEFTQKVIHPRYNVSRSYEVLLNRPISAGDILKWRRGLQVNGKKVTPLSIEPIAMAPSGCWLFLVLGEGIKREIRIMAEIMGYSVKMLRRTRIGKMELRNIPKGKYVRVKKEKLIDMIHKGGSL